MRRSDERLAEAARLYYVKELTQEQVAKELGTTRSNVSRMLDAARRQGIIRFKVTHPLARQPALEQRIVEVFELSEAVVLAASSADELLERTGELAARWLAEHVEDGQAITLSWGRTLKAMAGHLEVERAYDVSVVQIGGDMQLDPRLSGHELVREVAARLGGQYSYLHAPAILDSPKTVSDLLANRNIAAEMEKARQADIALVGIGGFGHGFSAQIIESAHLSADERAQLEDLAPAGDIGARFFDEWGEQVPGPLRDRVLALELEELAAIPTVVAVAAGAQKARGVWAALRGGLVDTIVCDQSVAAAALHLERAAA